MKADRRLSTKRCHLAASDPVPFHDMTRLDSRTDPTGVATLPEFGLIMAARVIGRYRAAFGSHLVLNVHLGVALSEHTVCTPLPPDVQAYGSRM